MPELAFVALLLGVAVPLIIWREPIGRYLSAWALGFAIWWDESDTRAFILRDAEAKRKAQADVERAAMKAAGERKHAVDLVT
jgi:hypothetical protein